MIRSNDVIFFFYIILHVPWKQRILERSKLNVLGIYCVNYTKSNYKNYYVV